MKFFSPCYGTKTQLLTCCTLQIILLNDTSSFPVKSFFWPLIPQTLGHFTPYYIKTSDQNEISQSENSLQPKTHTASQKVGSDNFSREGGYDWDRWQLGSAKTDLDSNSQ